MNEAGTNRAMPENCPQCGATLPAGALAGLCPACLLQQGAAADTATHPEAKPFVPPTPEELARLFPQLEILGLLGKGGMGAVYKARQKQLDRIVALKLLPPGIGSDPAFAERFAREARALARLNHPGIVTLYEFGQVESQPSTLNPQPCLCYFLMEFVDGVNLRQLLAGGRISSREALAIVPQICDALQYAHDQGIVHRDIKPENVLLDRRGRVKVADFGLAKLVEANPPLPPVLSRSDGGKVADKPGEATTPVLTEAGKIMGTPQYMAPEQVENPSEVDRRADIYALGVVFYQMLTGELPGQPIVPPSRACSTVQIDARLDEIVLRALERKPELRYQQASILKTQVETIASTPPTGTPAAALPRIYRGVDYRSKATLFGLPLLHVADGIDPATGKRRVAKGIIAIGGMAKGVLAIGGVAMGGFAFGGITLGVFTVGGLALGLLSTGGLAVGLIAALGGLAVAPIALGGGAVGYFAFGGAAFGVHPWSSLGRDAAAEAFFGNRAQGFMQRANLLMMLLIGVVVMLAVLVPAWLQSRLAQADSGGGGGETGPSAGGRAACSARTSSGQRNPWFAFCATLTYAGTTLFGVLCELLRSSLPGRWLILAFVLLACATGVLALLLRRFASVDTLRSAYRVSACLAFLTALPLIAFAAFFILAMLDEGFGWHPAPDEAVIVPLIWLGALSLPVCGWRLWRAARRLPNGSTASGGKPAPASYWGRYAIGVLVALLLLVAIVGGAMLLANALGIIRHATSTPGLVSRWRADGDAQDSAGRNHGVLHGDAGFVAGKVGQAFSFSGRTNSFIEVPDSPTLRLTNALTIEFWVKRQDLEAEDYIINKGGDYTRGVLNYGVTINQPRWDSGLAFTFAGGFRRSTSIADLDWHHIAVVARNGDEDPTFYLDGVVQPVTARGGPLHLSLPPSVEPLRIGAQVDTASGWCFYSKAVVDELSIYDRALGPAEIEARFAAGQRGKHPPGHGLSALLRPAATRPESSATAEFHYRAFEAEAALVDRLIPSSTRRPGVQPSAKALVNFGQPVSERQVGDFKMTVKVGLAESQAAEIGAGTLRALLDGMAAKPGLLTEQRRTIGSWPLVADSWSSSLADTNFFGSSGGTGFLGARRKNGILQARMECSVSHGLDALHAQPPLGVYSRILYEGNAPTNGALVFLVPFLRHNDTPRYFVWLFEIRDQTAPPRAGTTSGTNHLPLEEIGAPTAFGPVIERVLPDPDNRAGKGNDETLRLRTGQLSSVLDDAPKEGGGRSRALVASEGDLYAEYDDYVGRRWALITHGLKLSDLTPSQWENASASELNAALNIPTAVEQVEVTGATLYVLPDGLLPITFAFETRDGARGILQVTAFTDNPRGVKLRYKLARAATTRAALKPIPPKALELVAEWKAFLASVHTMTNISEQAARDQAANAWEVRIGEQLKGTVAEPVWQQLNAQIAEWKEAIQAQDAARAWAASRQVEALGAELARMLGLPETASGPTPSPAAGFQFRWVAREGDTNSPADLLSCRQGRGPEQKVRVLREVVLSGDDVESAGFTQLGADQKELVLVLTLEASGKFAEATARNVGRQLAIVWNGRVISAPIVQAAITSRNANIAGAFTDAEAQRLLDLLNHRAASTVSFSGTPGPGLPSGTASQLGAGFQIRLVALEGSTEPADDLADPTDPAGRRRIRVLRQVLLDSSAIARAGYELPYGWKSEGGTILVTTGRSQPTPERCIELDLTLAGGRAWEEITATNLNRQLAIIFRGQVLSAPVIRQRLPGTHLTIRTPLSADLVRDVVAALNAVPGSPPPAWEFSEPTEATLRWQPRAYSAIDLESGRCLTNTSPDLPPPGSIYGLPPALHEWMLTNGLDLTLLSGSRSSFTLGSCLTATWPVTVGGGSPVTLLTTPTNGHPITAADVVYNWRLMTRDEQSSRVIFGTISSKQLDGYLFRTRKGCLGVLEVLQAPTNTPGVRILYKRVQSARHQAEILAKLQALKIEETGESARWARISDELAKMSKTQLREILPRVIGRDELLETLLSALKSAQGRLSAFDATNTPGSARGATELEDLVKQVAEVERRTDERIAGILQGLKVRKDSINAGLKGLEEAMEDAQRPKPTSVK